MSFKDHAAGLRALGFSVFPTHAPGMPVKEGMDEKQIGKAPLVKWKPYQTVAPEDAVVQGWYKKFPTANIAICCGPVSGLLVLDVDGMEAMNALEDLQDQHGDLPDTWRVATSRGQHIYFRYTSDDLRNTNGELGKGIESKTLGATCHAAGSVHRSGHIYDWVSPFSPAECELAPAPEWLLALLRRKPTPEYTPPPPSAKRVASNVAEKREDSYKRKAWAGIIGELATAVEGSRNQTFFRVAAKAYNAVNAGVIGRAEAEQALVLQARAIGLDELEIKTTMQSAFRKTGNTPMRLPDFTADRPGQTPAPRKMNGVHPPEPPPHDEPPYDPETGELIEPPAKALIKMFKPIDVEPPPAERKLPVWYDDDDDKCLSGMEVTAQYCATRELTDLGNAHRLLAWFGQHIMYSEGTDWMVWDGIRWRRDKHYVQRLAHKTVFRMAWEEEYAPKDPAVQAAMAKWRKTSMSADKLNAMVSIARHIRAFDPETLDADPYLLNTKSGIVDLRTGMIEPHDASKLMSKLVPYEVAQPGDNPEKFIQFMQACLLNDDEMMDYFHRHLGYTLTGSTHEQVFFFYYGLGGNGKGQLIEIMTGIMGDYAVTEKPDLIMDTRQMGNISFRMVRLKGARAMFMSEPSANAVLDVALVKSLTGEDRLTGEHKYHDLMSWTPTHKVFMAANQRPKINDQTDGTWRRMHLIPFDASFEKSKDKVFKIGAKLLRDEGPQILRWLIDGAILNYADFEKDKKLAKPARVEAATDDYRDASDVLNDFLADTFIMDAGESEKCTDVYDAFKKWCRMRGDNTLGKMTDHTFSEKMVERRFKKSKTNGRNMWRGVMFRSLVETPWRNQFNGDNWQREF